jgi:metallo-beta-lactamase class B
MKKIYLIFPCLIFITMVGFINQNKIVNEKNSVTLSKINDKVWVHTTYEYYDGVNTPSNGLVVITSKGVVLIDTPWNNEQTEELLKLIKKEFKKDVILGIITHAHVDRIGGIDTLLKYKITVESTKLTAEKAVENGYKSPKAILGSDTLFKIGKTNFEVYYPGEGHTADNILVWIPDYKILFGGCFIKSVQSKNLGNLQDANLKEWPISVNKAIRKFPETKIVIPGHGEWGDKTLLKHTLELFNK